MAAYATEQSWLKVCGLEREREGVWFREREREA
jgi:hypothetical protein